MKERAKKLNKKVSNVEIEGFHAAMENRDSERLYIHIADIFIAPERKTFLSTIIGWNGLHVSFFLPPRKERR